MSSSKFISAQEGLVKHVTSCEPSLAERYTKFVADPQNGSQPSFHSGRMGLVTYGYSTIACMPKM